LDIDVGFTFAADEHRREAELGARWALRSIAAPVKVTVTVTVTEVMIANVDTGVGDVHEATARAVWQALDFDHRAAQYIRASAILLFFEHAVPQRWS
jgi:hypothetical protein